jgi:signal transduction histidine kinase
VRYSYRLEPNPFALLIQRVGGVALALTLLVTLAVGAAAQGPAIAQRAASAGGAMWALFLTVPLLLAPFVARSRQMLREFAMLAGVSTVAAALDLVFVAVFSLGPFTSFTLAVFASLGVYAAVRQWVLNHLAGVSVLTTERTFEQLYRVAREVQVQPARHAALLAQLLRDLFDPLEMLHVPRQTAHARVVASGSALMVPLASGPILAVTTLPPGGTDTRPGSAFDTNHDKAVVLRFARRGQRLFTEDDARLADRVVEQLRRAVAYDKAVERGRSEERLRIAQDLHDDIGARLLTLMYQAPNLEMEEYIRHTLKDLKTLTRGLAAGEHPLSHAAAEWKADLTQRLAVAQVQLGWQFNSDRDLKLSMVQWSALTRIVRELVSNTLHHAQATRVDVGFNLQGNVLQLQVADDGNGRDPQAWSHGLGLGGVRKRVKLLGGTVQWSENTPSGIVCKVRVPDFSQRS